MAYIYRPWGLLPWVLAHCPVCRWGLLGSLSFEERSLATWLTVKNTLALESVYLAQIQDAQSRFSDQIDRYHQQRRAVFLAEGGRAADVHEHLLAARTGEIIELAERLISDAGPNVILDMTSLPKRFFFPICKLLLRSGAVRTLLVTYTAPIRYSHEPLAEDFQDWRALPLFSGSEDAERPDLLVVSVGHLAMGLPDQIEHGSPRMEVKLLFPFPNAPASYQRTWQFLRTVEQNLRGAATQVKHVHAMDVSDAFDHLLSLSDNGARRVLSAPYGPKPISLAMCIYATLTESPVFYTQPRVYNPEYSYGIKTANGIYETYAYCLRLDGHEFYQVL